MLSPYSSRSLGGTPHAPMRQHSDTATLPSPPPQRADPSASGAMAAPIQQHQSTNSRPGSSIPSYKVPELIALLREIRAHAAATEQQLWELDSGIKETMRKTNAYWDTIATKRGAAFAASLRASMHDGQRSSKPSAVHGASRSNQSDVGSHHRGSNMDSIDDRGYRHSGTTASSVRDDPNATGDPSSAAAAMDSIVAAQNTTLRHRLSAMVDEMRQDQEAKIRLLQAVEYHLYGAPRATLADRSLLGAGGQGQVPAVLQSLANVVKRLPEGNVDVLKRSRFFEFALAAVRSAVRMHQRDGVVNSESAILNGCQHSGFPAKLVSAMSSITAEDLQAL